MAQIFRVERTKNFTVMSNHHFKNKNLTLKAKGLLSLMLSLPDDWNYNMQGLATLSRDGIDSVRSAIKELEHAYSARTAHPFQRNGAPFRFKLSKAQQVD